MTRREALAATLAAPAAALAEVHGTGQPGSAADLPRVVLIGDSIRLGYAPAVAEQLKGKAIVLSPPENGGDSAHVLAGLEAWAIRERPDVVHLNCGLHDLKLDRQTRTHQVPIEQYGANLGRILARLRAETRAAVVLANTTPVDDSRHARRGAGFDRLAADVERYNSVALAAAREAQVPLHDLHGLVTQAGPARLLGPDGVHFTPEGSALLAEAVADCVLRQLAARNAPAVFTPQPGGPEVAAAYRKAEAERDAQVPAVYSDATVGVFRPPATGAEWRRQRPGVLRKVLASLGDLPRRPSPANARLVCREERSGYILERLALHNGVDGEISMLLLLPERRRAPAPAVMWLHSSTPDKNQVLRPNTEGGAEPLGEVLVRAGYVVLAPDAYWHGERAGTGPGGPVEGRSDEHQSLFKYHLWMGRTLWGMFVRDDRIALDYLCSRPEVDTRRIGATGMSMGSTRAWWLAALDERVTVTVAIACLTRYQDLIRHGQLRQHGVYYFTFGMLKHFDSEAVLALIAPRALLALTGELDAGSPADGVRAIEQPVAKVYAATGARDRFQSILYPEVGHTVTPEMRRAMLAWFAHWLQP